VSEQTSGAASGTGSAGPEVEYRLSPRYRRPMLTRFVVLAILTVICVVSRADPTVAAAAYATGPLAVIFGVLYLWQGRFATKVTGRGIAAHGYFNHFVPWHEVRCIEVNGWTAGRLADNQDYGGQMYAGGSIRGSSVRMARTSPNRMGKLDSIKVVRTNGRKLRLRAPLVSGWASDPDFTDKAKQLEQLCARYARGAL
jgi:hypothetical protein